LLLLHGLWTGAWIWQGLGGYLAHRGWESWAPSLLEGDRPWSDHEAMVDAVRAVAVAQPAPPIIVAHDLGIVAAVALAHTLEIPAVVAIAPVLPPSAGGGRSLLRRPQFWRTRLGAAVAPPPGGGLARALVGAGVDPTRLRADAGAVVRALAADRLSVPTLASTPGLVVGGPDDPWSPSTATRALAERQGWEHRLEPGCGHLPMLEPGWERRADDLHRWIVRTLGADLLAFVEEEDDDV
jgi:hypothetical protein